MHVSTSFGGGGGGLSVVSENAFLRFARACNYKHRAVRPLALAFVPRSRGSPGVWKPFGRKRSNTASPESHSCRDRPESVLLRPSCGAPNVGKPKSFHNKMIYLNDTTTFCVYVYSKINTELASILRWNK